MSRSMMKEMQEEKKIAEPNAVPGLEAVRLIAGDLREPSHTRSLIWIGFNRPLFSFFFPRSFQLKSYHEPSGEPATSVHLLRRMSQNVLFFSPWLHFFPSFSLCNLPGPGLRVSRISALRQSILGCRSLTDEEFQLILNCKFSMYV